MCVLSDTCSSLDLRNAGSLDPPFRHENRKAVSDVSKKGQSALLPCWLVRIARKTKGVPTWYACGELTTSASGTPSPKAASLCPKGPVPLGKEHVPGIASLHYLTEVEWEMAKRPIFGREIACDSFDPAQDCQLTATKFWRLVYGNACLAKQVVEHEHVGN